MEFWEIAKSLRINKHLTQAQLADRMWVKKSIISAYETDTRQPSLDMLIKYSKEFKVSTDFLLGIDTDNVIHVSDLTEGQISTLRAIINEFSKKNENIFK